MQVMAAFTLAHLSDPHLPPLPSLRLRDLAGKRALGYLNWTRNRRNVHKRDVLDALVSDLQAQKPDHIAITGDLVNLALEAEFAPSRAWLESVGAPERVTVIPGNHDAYVRATQHRFAQAWGNYRDGDDATDAGVTFPSLRRRGLLAVLKQHGVELVLHGHDHVHSTIWIDGPKGSIPAIGVPSASAVAHGRYPAAAYNLFAIEREGAAWRCEQTVRGF